MDCVPFLFLSLACSEKEVSVCIVCDITENLRGGRIRGKGEKEWNCGGERKTNLLLGDGRWKGRVGLSGRAGEAGGSGWRWRGRWREFVGFNVGEGGSGRSEMGRGRRRELLGFMWEKEIEREAEGVCWILCGRDGEGGGGRSEIRRGRQRELLGFMWEKEIGGESRGVREKEGRLEKKEGSEGGRSGVLQGRRRELMTTISERGDGDGEREGRLLLLCRDRRGRGLMVMVSKRGDGKREKVGCCCVREDEGKRVTNGEERGRGSGLSENKGERELLYFLRERKMGGTAEVVS